MMQIIDSVGLVRDPQPELLHADADSAAFAQAARKAMADQRYDSVVCAAVNAFQLSTEEVSVAVQEVATEAAKPLIGVFLDFHHPSTSHGEPDTPGLLPRFDGSVDAIQALSALTAYATWRDRDPGTLPRLEVDIQAARRLVNRILGDQPQGRELTELETAELLQTHGINLVPQFAVGSLTDAIAAANQLGWNVVLKATTAAVRGRPDLASVHRNIDNPVEMADAWKDLRQLVAEIGLSGDEDLSVAKPVVQAMAPPGVALSITSREDAAFGPIISLGLDGIPSELLGDIVYRVPPLTTVDAAQMVKDLRAAPTLFGRYGAPGVDIAGIEDLLHRVAQLADAIPQLASVTLRPCVASASSIAVLGTRVFVAPTADQRDPLARVL
jgi:acyl-CoA synthetase (NDP forming)